MFKDLVFNIIKAGLIAAKPIVREKVVEQYKVLKKKSTESETPVDDLAIIVLSAVIGVD